jgi:CBS domain-containing protein
MKIKKIMRKPLIIEKDISLKRAAGLMTKHDISSLIFLKKDRIQGIITQEDLVENFTASKKVSKIMSKKVIIISENAKITKAIDLIKINRISVLPVLNDKKHLVGVVDAKDILIDACSTDDFLMN